MSEEKKKEIIFLSVISVLLVATVVAFIIAGSSGKKKAAPVESKSSVASTQAQPTTAATTVDSRGSTDSVKKLIAIYFEDGPSPESTQKLIDGLKQRGAHATFFMLGQNIPGNEKILQSAADAGCEIGIHGYSNTSFKTLGTDKTAKEVQNTANLIKDAIGKAPVHVRVPGDDFDEEIRKKIQDLGCDIIMYNVDTKDDSTLNTDSVYSAIVENGTDGGDILCLHDGYPTTVDGALKAVDELMAKGFKFVTISELEAARDKFTAGRIWKSAHEFYDNSKMENNLALAGLNQSSSQGTAQKTTAQVEITYPDGVKPGSDN